MSIPEYDRKIAQFLDGFEYIFRHQKPKNERYSILNSNYGLIQNGKFDKNNTCLNQTKNNPYSIIKIIFPNLMTHLDIALNNFSNLEIYGSGMPWYLREVKTDSIFK